MPLCFHWVWNPAWLLGSSACGEPRPTRGAGPVRGIQQSWSGKCLRPYIKEKIEAIQAFHGLRRAGQPARGWASSLHGSLTRSSSFVPQRSQTHWSLFRPLQSHHCIQVLCESAATFPCFPYFIGMLSIVHLFPQEQKPCEGGTISVFLLVYWSPQESTWNVVAMGTSPNSETCLHDSSEEFCWGSC